jgi:hypothetical protein
MLAVAALVLGAAGALAAELVGVPGSATKYPATLECSVAARPVKMVLTGTALRQKLTINLYAIGSYVQQGAGVKSAEELAAADCPKRLHLVMERSLDGKCLAEAFRAAIRLNYPEPAFASEINTLTQLLRTDSAPRGSHILMTHVPGVGLHFIRSGKAEFLIKNPSFSRAVWDIYLGKKNVGEAIKKGLVSRL